VVDAMQFSSGCQQEHFHGGTRPGFVPSSQLQPSTILMVKIISMGAPAMSGMTFSTGYNQYHFQEGRGVITVAAVFAQGSVNHEDYLGFDHGCVDKGYVLDAFFGEASIIHNYCSYLVEVHFCFDRHRDYDQVKQHQLQWDPGGFGWRRLGVRPNFKKGGMSGAPPDGYAGLPLDRYMGRAHQTTEAEDYKYQQVGDDLVIQWITNPAAAAPSLPLPSFPQFVYL
jgi:hypothetical protein